jgi:hypothetical protein
MKTYHTSTQLSVYIQLNAFATSDFFNFAICFNRLYGKVNSLCHIKRLLIPQSDFTLPYKELHYTPKLIHFACCRDSLYPKLKSLCHIVSLLIPQSGIILPTKHLSHIAKLILNEYLLTSLHINSLKYSLLSIIITNKN